MELKLFIETEIVLGEVQDLGNRRIVRVMGGKFWSAELNGTILEGGGDWQNIRPDGVVDIDTRYTLKTDDGALIYLTNQGLRDGVYMRTFSRFESNDARYAWVNKRLFVSDGAKVDGVVKHTFYEMK
ncbi:DUF3237 domain-containing protein [Aquirufa regiilacus]|uniref:UPF0311 protein PQG45_04565 n=1 Tax=Aquirufa regiilacus TaxID=3024868 RepID=A0ABU3TR56_9BACT|nr:MULTISPECIES: DUF3237 domain-containing protein [unclassified Aquirufa]MDT8886730.1 DUF3237 domain-containing protein [Aquirufa sp. LEPPI-3A]MDU0808305.1 DUF3237 domain-containing protein [Aquirufa sp. LEOWEIH-7C]